MSSPAESPLGVFKTNDSETMILLLWYNDIIQFAMKGGDNDLRRTLPA